MAQEGRIPEWSMNLHLLFRSLKHRNFRLFFMGQGLSLIGTWMQMTAVAWLVWRLSHSALLLGLVGFAARIPTFALAPFAGVLVDRVDRYRLVVLTQVLVGRRQSAVRKFAVRRGGYGQRHPRHGVG
jgi:MFS family permease